MFSRIFCFGYCSRVVSLVVFSLLGGLSADDESKTNLIKCFDRLEEHSPESQEVLIEGIHFLQNLIQEVNIQYGCSLKATEAVNLVRANLHQFSFSAEIKQSLMALIELIKAADAQDDVALESCFIQPMYIPLIWNWGGAKKSFSRDKYQRAVSAIELPITKETLEDPPAGVIVGAVEILAGALLCIIPHPIAYGVGAGLISDGISRVFNNIPLNEENAFKEMQATKIENVD